MQSICPCRLRSLSRKSTLYTVYTSMSREVCVQWHQMHIDFQWGIKDAHVGCNFLAQPGIALRQRALSSHGLCARNDAV